MYFTQKMDDKKKIKKNNFFFKKIGRRGEIAFLLNIIQKFSS